MGLLTLLGPFGLAFAIWWAVAWWYVSDQWVWPLW
jgi:hypothetical protein